MGVPGEGAFLRTRGRVLLKRGVQSFEIQISDGGSFRALCSSASNNLNKTTCDAGGASASSMRIRMKEAFGARGAVAAQRRIRIRSRIPFGVLPTGGLRNAAMFYVGGDVALLAAEGKRRLVARARGRGRYGIKTITVVGAAGAEVVAQAAGFSRGRLGDVRVLAGLR